MITNFLSIERCRFCGREIHHFRRKKYSADSRDYSVLVKPIIVGVGASSVYALSIEYHARILLHACIEETIEKRRRKRRKARR